jgi:hypothetical protein
MQVPMLTCLINPIVAPPSKKTIPFDISVTGWQTPYVVKPSRHALASSLGDLHQLFWVFLMKGTVWTCKIVSLSPKLMTSCFCSSASQSCHAACRRGCSCCFACAGESSRKGVSSCNLLLSAQTPKLLQGHQHFSEG